MKIVFITSEKLPVPPVKGGAVETWIYEAAKRLSNHDVYSLCVDDSALKNVKANSKIHFDFYRYDFWAKILLCSYKLPFKQDRSTLYYLPYSRWSALKAKEINADIIHVHSRPQFVPILRQHNPRAKIILHVHNVSVFDLDGWLWPQSLMEKVDSIVTCSEYLQKEFVSRYPTMKNKTRVLYNAIDVEVFDPKKVQPSQILELSQKYSIQSNDTMILFTGRLIEYKGVHLLIEAFKDLLKVNQNIKLFIVGGLTYSNNTQTTYIRRLKEMAEGFENKIIFTGFIDRALIPAFLELSDIYVVPSLWKEPFGVAVIEGMAMEKPVVAFKTGGIPEIIVSSLNGILLEENTKEALGAALQNLIDQPNLREELGKQARKSVAMRFSWPVIMKDINDCYESLLKG